MADLEALQGAFHTVVCLDVFTPPQRAVEAMVRHLASLSRDRLIISFAPYRLPLALLKAIGSVFPCASKATRAYNLKEPGIVAAAATAGFQPTGVTCSAVRRFTSHNCWSCSGVGDQWTTARAWSLRPNTTLLDRTIAPAALILICQSAMFRGSLNQLPRPKDGMRSVQTLAHLKVRYRIKHVYRVDFLDLL